MNILLNAKIIFLVILVGALIVIVPVIYNKIWSMIYLRGYEDGVRDTILYQDFKDHMPSGLREYLNRRAPERIKELWGLKERR